jgi:hypothetical protein
MPIYLQERQIPTWRFHKNLSLRTNIEVALAKMASCRQAKPSKMDLQLYSSILEPLDMRAFQVAMAILAESDRDQGETAFPTLGSILAAMDDARELTPRFSLGAKEINMTPVFADSQQKRLTQ